MSLSFIVETRVKETVKKVLGELGHSVDDEKINKAYTSVDTPTPTPVIEKKVLPKKDESKEVKKVVANDKNTCVYRKSRGSSSNEMCGKAANVTVDNEWYCGTKKDEKTYTGHAKSAFLAKQKREVSVKKVATLPKTKDEAKKVSNEASKKMTAKIIEKTIIVKDKNTGNHIHRESGIVFNKETKKAMGTQSAKGQLVPLTKENMKYCDEKGWLYDEEEEVVEEEEEVVEEEEEIVDEEEEEVVEDEEEEDVEDDDDLDDLDEDDIDLDDLDLDE